MSTTTARHDDDQTLEFLGRLSDAHQAGEQRHLMRQQSAQDRFFSQRRKAQFYAGSFGFSTDHLTSSGHGGFTGGQITRLTDGWTPQQIGPNRMTATGGQFLRNRARDLVANNPYAFAGVVKFLNNVIGCGIHPKPQFADRNARRLWIQAWDRYCGHTAHGTPEVDITGDQSFTELVSLWLMEVITAGGCLMYFREVSRRGRTIPLAVELIPEERFADDVQWSGSNRKTSNPIQQGIEYDAGTGRTLAYWVRGSMPNDDGTPDLTPVRLPRELCEYGFYKRRIGQRRGWTLLAPAIQWLFALGYYTDAELFASDAKASWAYMIETGEGSEINWPDLADSSPETGTLDVHGNTIEKLEPGMVFRGLPGDTIKAVGPNVPGSDSMPWIELIQRSIAAGIEQSYEEVTGDYSKGNMASVRMAAESVRKGYRRMHKHAITHCANPTYRRFAQHGARAGLDGFPRPAEFVADIDEWLRVKWSTPSWSSPNPVHDATAAKIYKELQLKSDRDLVEAAGGDVDELYDELEFEQAERERRGLGSSAEDVDTEQMLAEEADDAEQA